MQWQNAQFANSMLTNRGARKLRIYGVFKETLIYMKNKMALFRHYVEI